MKRLALAVASALWPAAASAAAMRRPFEVGGGEGGGAYGGWTGWLLEAQSRLTHTMALDLHAIPHSHAAFAALIGAGFVYGVAHAAGPGHGKAVIASYMMANESALRRGIVLALLAAVLQGAVAVAIVGVAAILLNATADRMNAIADALASASYLGVAGIGAWLAWKKGLALARVVRAYFGRRAALASGALFAGAPWAAATALAGGGGFRAGEPGALETVAGDDCGHLHAPDPRTLGAGFSWRAALSTVAAAGARPCSGSLLILVFALAQGLFVVGVAAVAAVSVGTAITTGALASLAVFAKGLAVKFAAGEDTRVALVARVCELAAALAVLAFGLAMFFATRGGA
ncbi:MAG TPA: high frequency lysogenization protein HflD [Roseiarcus sp.]|nr:high frequency lysogenization protein HflD [Roseiarcus sp.]